jgi:O2-independent ubiquinone biosynthesis protein UbiU
VHSSQKEGEQESAPAAIDGMNIIDTETFTSRERAAGESLTELVCPAGSLPALKAAIDNGADCVYLGFRDATNARNFAGLNFGDDAIAEGIRYAHECGRKVLLALNTYPQPAQWMLWREAVDRAADAGIDAVILADPALMQYAASRHPALRLHLSVQGSATNFEAINFYRERFGIARAVLPRVLSLEQVEYVLANTQVEIEVFGFGSLCVMVEGRCALSSYATGESPNTHGVCSPAKSVRWQQTSKGLESRLNGVLIDRYASDESAGYPTLCKGRFEVNDESYYAIEEPASLNTLELLPQLMNMGVRAIKIEGRQRSPAYVAQVTRVWRDAIDQCRDAAQRYSVKPGWMNELNKVAEGQQHTLGAYHRPWK